jgi:hypothetical protein
MNSVNNFIRSIGRAASVAPAAAILALSTGCGGDREIKTYRVAKEDTQTHAAHEHASAAGGMSERPSIPHLHAKTPEGWQEVAPEKMRVASFRVSGPGGKSAEVAVIPLPGVSKIELRSVNMWREELGLEELTQEQLKDETTPVAVGDTTGLMVEMAGTREGDTSGAGAGVLGAVAERKNITWFIKMAGDKEVVALQKNNFVSYLKSLEFHEGAHGSADTASGGRAEVTQVAKAPSADQAVSANTEKSPAGSEKPNFKAPANWTTKAPGPMITSAYNVQVEGGSAEVTISKFPGAVGGMEANIQRWRGQLGLEPGTAEEARKSAEMIEVGGKKESYMVDLKGTNVRTGKAARMVSIGVPYQGETWFFKLMGDESAVEKEKEKFVQFVKAAY